MVFGQRSSSSGFEQWRQRRAEIAAACPVLDALRSWREPKRSGDGSLGQLTRPELESIRAAFVRKWRPLGRSHRVPTTSRGSCELEGCGKTSQHGRHDMKGRPSP